MTGAASIATRYIALWNETDPDHRKTLMADLWTEAGTYRDPLMQGEGHDQIDTLIAGVQGQFPGFRFALVGQPDGYGDQVRFSGSLVRRVATAPSRAPTSRPWRTAASVAWSAFSTRCRPQPEARGGTGASPASPVLAESSNPRDD